MVTLSTIEDADEAAATTRFDFAILDIDVAGKTSFDFAHCLRKLGVPYIFASGYGDQVPLDGGQVGAIVLQKPFGLDHLRQALVRVAKTAVA